MITRLNKRKNNKKGFTLAEMLIVVGLIIVLMAVGAVAIFKYQKTLRQKEYDSKAEIIYQAAENRLSKLRLIGASSSYGAGKNDAVLPSLGVSAIGYRPQDCTSKTEPVIYAFTSEEKDSPIAQAILPEGAIDDELYSDYWVVEYNIETARIYAIFYGKEPSKFTHGLYDKAWDEYRVKDANGLRSNSHVGYYGGDEVTTIETNKLNPVIEIVNEETLTAIVGCENINDSKGTISFKVTVSDGEHEKQIEVNNADIERYGNIFRATVTLDDLSSDDKRFKSLFPELIPGADIKVTVIAESTDEKIDSGTDFATDNSLFAKNTSGDDTKATIKCCRHLQNLDKNSGVSEKITSAVQTTDVDFKEKTEEVSKPWNTVYNNKPFTPIINENLESYEVNGVKNDKSKYYRIVSLNTESSANSGLFGIIQNRNGKATTLSNIWLESPVINGNGSSGAVAGTIQTGTKLINCRAYLSDADANASRVDEDNHDNLTKWINGNCAGGLVGTVGGAGSADITESFAATVVDGTTASGGLVGNSAGNLSISCSYADCYLFGSTTGGLLGTGNIGTAVSCYSAGYQYGTVAAAGFTIGNAGTLKSCYSVCYFDTGDNAIVNPLLGGTANSALGVYFLEGNSKRSFAVSAVGEGRAYDHMKSQDFINELLANGGSFSMTEGGNPAKAKPYNLLKQELPTGYEFPKILLAAGERRSAAESLQHFCDWHAEQSQPQKFEIHNEDKLYLSAEIEDNTNCITVSVTGDDSKVTKLFVIELDRNANAVSVKNIKAIEFDGDNFDAANLTEIDYLPVTVAKDEQNKYVLNITLDDITSSNGHFTQLFSGLVPGENISVRMYDSNVAWSTINQTGSKTTNSLFATSSNAPDTVQVAYVRHLQNLDPAVSNVTASVHNAEMNNSITWDTVFYNTIFNYNGSSSVEGGFYGLYNNNLTSFNGNYYTLSDFIVNAASADFSTAVGADSAGSGNSGLFRLIQNGMTVKNLKINHISSAATGYGHAGTVAAEIKDAGATIDTVLALSNIHSVTSSGASYSSGGLIGYVDCGAATLNITNSAATIPVYASGNAGGVVGTLASGNAVFKQVFAGGQTVNAKYTDSKINIISYSGHAGGIVGAVEAGSGFNMNMVFGAASVSAPLNMSAGGLVGEIEQAGTSTYIEKAYVIAPVSDVQVSDSQSEKEYSSFHGAFIGTVENGIVNNLNTYYLPEIYANAVLKSDSSQVRYIGESSSEALQEPVKLAYYEKDGEGNVISAKIYGDTMQVKTFSYDSKLVTRTGSKMEYPFSIWTSFSFKDDKTSFVSSDLRFYGTYYGDWQPVLNEPTVLLNVNFFEVVDGVEAVRVSKPIICDKVNSVVVPNFRKTGFSVIGFKYFYRNNDEDLVLFEDKVYEPSGGFITIPADYCSKEYGDVYAEIQYKKDDNTCVVKFNYDKLHPDTGTDYQVLRENTATTGVTKMNQINSTAPTIDGYIFDGWYREPERVNKVDFESETVITDDISVYAKYIMLEYYTVSINFMYQIGDGEQQQLINVPQYQIDDERSQYRIRLAKGTTFDENIICPDFGGQYKDCEIIAEPVTAGQPGSISEASTSTEQKRIVHVKTENGIYEDYSFKVVYKVPEEQAASAYCYTIVYEMGHTSVDTTTSGETIYNYASESCEYYPYKTNNSPTIFVAPVEETCPEIVLGDIDGYNRETPRYQLKLENWMEGGKQKTDELGRKYYKIRVKYERKQYYVQFESAGGSYISPVKLYFGEPMVDAKNTAGSPSRTGYKFNSWSIPYKKGDSSAVYTSWNEGMPENNVVSVADWTALKSKFHVVYWYEMAESTDASVITNYSYMASVEKEGLTGTTVKSTDYQNYPDMSTSKYTWIDKNHFTFNSALAETVSISSDGSTVVNVYYSRKNYTLTFKDNNKTVATITAKYGASIKGNFASAPFTTTYKGRAWEDTGSTYSYALQTLDIMPGSNVTFKLYGQSTTTLKTIYYYVQQPGKTIDTTKWPSSTNNFSKAKEIGTYFKYITYEEEYHEMEGFTRYSPTTNNSGFYQMSDGKYRKDYSNNAVNLFYMRNTYKLEFYSNGELLKTKTNIPYETELTNEYFKPNIPASLTSDYVFGGWYSDPAFSNIYNFKTGKMPASNVALYALWIAPQYDVKFYDQYYNDFERQNELYSFSVEINKDLDGTITDKYGNLLPAYTPSRENYVFDGWFYMDGGFEKAYYASMDITSALNVYAKWSEVEPDDPTVRRNVKVNYIGKNSDGSEEKLGEFELEDQKVGYLVSFVAQAYDGWYAEKMTQSIEVSENPELNIVNFYYKPVEAWAYTVEYYACYSNTYDDPYLDIESEGYTFETATTTLLAYKRVDVKSYNIYDSVTYSSSQIPLEVGDFSNYNYIGYEYLRDEGGTPEHGTSPVVSISDFDTGGKVIKFYIQPSPDEVYIADRDTVYNGQVQRAEDIEEDVNNFAHPTDYSLETCYIYKYFIDGTEVDENDVKNAGSYAMNVYVILKLTDDNQQDNPKYFLLWRDTNQDHSVVINPRQVYLTSVSAVAPYDPDRSLQNSTLNPNDIYIEIYHPDGQTGYNPNSYGVNTVYMSNDDPDEGFIDGDGAQYLFAVDAFRQEVGMSDNTFSYSFNEGTVGSNYQIILSYGTLTVYWNFDVEIYDLSATNTNPDEPIIVYKYIPIPDNEEIEVQIPENEHLAEVRAYTESVDMKVNTAEGTLEFNNGLDTETKSLFLYTPTLKEYVGFYDGNKISTDTEFCITTGETHSETLKIYIKNIGDESEQPEDDSDK